ncbi:hypothetical protein [Rugamonas sp.]|uniref:hypothetical protein n=1 Tax=Rugamonas sp. TaxID=1926287 RepID=UPI0025F3FA8A|nr:hypothetical protein [Rugamonas sp.]
MNDEKLEQAIFQILRMTHLGEIKWVRRSAPRNLGIGTDSVFSSYFETEYMGQRLALYQQRFRFFSIEIEAERWSERVILALLTDDGELQFEFPQSSQVHDLFETVQYKTSNVDGFLQNLLNSKS